MSRKTPDDFPPEFPEELRHHFNLAMGVETGHSAIAFLPNGAYFGHRIAPSSGLHRVSMIGLHDTHPKGKPQGGSFINEERKAALEVIAKLPSHAVVGNKLVFLKHQEGYFSAILGHPTRERIALWGPEDIERSMATERMGRATNPVFRKEVQRSANIAQHNLLKEVTHVILERKNIPALQHIAAFAPWVARGPLFNLDDENAQWLRKNPDVLREVSHCCEAIPSMDAKISPAEMIRQWKPEQVESFFRDPQRFGYSVREEELPYLAVEMNKPDLIPAVMRAGVFLSQEIRDRVGVSSYTQATYNAFEAEHDRIVSALGGEEEFHRLTLYRRSDETSPERDVLEKKVSNSQVDNLPDVPNLTMPAGGLPSGERSTQITK